MLKISVKAMFIRQVDWSGCRYIKGVTTFNISSDLLMDIFLLYNIDI